MTNRIISTVITSVARQSSSIIFLFCITLLIAQIILSDPTLAQITPKKMPFGIGGAEGAATPPTNAIAAWILAKQSEFYKAINAAVLAAKSDGSATWYLAWLAFA